MKPHLNSLDPDFYVDLHQIAETHEYINMHDSFHQIPGIIRWEIKENVEKRPISWKLKNKILHPPPDPDPHWNWMGS